MNAQEFKQKLIELEACEDAIGWVKGKTLKQAWETCQNGDWMNWIYGLSNEMDEKKLILCQGHQANTIRHKMTNQILLDAVDAAILYGEGKISKKDLYDIGQKAYHKYMDAPFFLDCLEGAAAFSCVVRISNYTAAYYTAKASDNPTKSISESADIARKYLPLPKF